MADVQRAIQAMLQAAREQDRLPEARVAKTVVCISRDPGSLGDEVAKILAEKLGVEVYDAKILEKIAERSHADAHLVSALDSGVSPVRDLWLYSLLTGQDLHPNTYKRHLVNVIMSLARVGGVIMGRGSHLVLSNSGALRVRFTASEGVAARRVAATQGVSLEAARKTIQDAAHKRGQFVWDTFHTRLNDPATFDLVVNTDNLDDPVWLAELVQTAMAKRADVKHVAAA